LSCCLASLPHSTPSAPRLFALSPCCPLCYLKLLLHHLIMLLQPITSSPCCATCCLKLPCYLELSHYFITFLPSLPHYLATISPQVPPNPPICCFVILLSCA
jgi:hypothetical protein